jgi:hypothetical protein
MRYLVTQTMSASKRRYWIVRDTEHSWLHHGPFADEMAAQAIARAKNASEAWKELLRTARAERKAASAQEDQIAA